MFLLRLGIETRIEILEEYQYSVVNLNVSSGLTTMNAGQILENLAAVFEEKTE